MTWILTKMASTSCIPVGAKEFSPAPRFPVFSIVELFLVCRFKMWELGHMWFDDNVMWVFLQEP